jgi:hypothetical protein
VLGLGLFYFLFISSRFSWKEKWLIGMWSIPLFLIFLVSTKVPMYLDRYVSFCLPFFYMSLGGLILLMGKKRFWLGAFLVMSFFYITAHRVIPEKRQVRTLVNEMKRMGTDVNTVFVICPDYFDLNILYYWNQEKFRQWGEQNVSNEGMVNDLVNEQIWAVRDSIDLSSLLDNSALTKLVYLDASADFSIPGNGISEWLQKHFNKKTEQEIPEHFWLRSFEVKNP